MAEKKVQGGAEKEAKAPSTIPLKHISYSAEVDGIFAGVKCSQQFKNEAQESIEAVYVFPMPEEASATGCAMQIGERRVEAELKEREKARKKYEEAIETGHHASLLEQERVNIFTMNVGGIEPGEEINVEVKYVQRVPWQAGGGRFVIPLVVAPRFIPGEPTGQQAGGWSPDTDEVPDASRITPVVAKEGVPYNADITVRFSPGFRCQLSSPSHPAIVEEREVGADETVEIQTGDIRTDRDVILVYESLSEVPEVAVHKGEFDSESFVLASIVPPGEVTPVGSDIVAVLDCSGSMGFMSGAKIEGLKVIAKKIAGNLRAQNVDHRLGILPFSNKEMVWPSHPIGEITEATEKFIDRLKASGGTDLGPALTQAHQMFTDSGRPGVILLVTDGQTESLRYTGKGVRIISVGIDTAVNDEVIKMLAKETGGTWECVYPGEGYDAVAGRMTGYISGPVLEGVSVEAKGADVVGLSDVFKARPATISLRFKAEPGQIIIKGKNPVGEVLSWDLHIATADECNFATHVWARDYIRENPDKDTQTETSLKYGVICRYTSFVAVSLKEIPGKKPERIEIPVNLPTVWEWEEGWGTTGVYLGLMGARRIQAGGVKRGTAKELTYLGFPTGRGVIRRIPPIPRPPVLPRPQPVIPTAVRFTLDAKDVVDRLVAILSNIKEDREATEKAFAGVGQEFIPEEAGKLPEDKKAMAYYFAVRLASYGLKLDRHVVAELRAKPKSELALAWYNLALREEGRPSPAILPAGDEASEYIAWKFGTGKRPEDGEWSLIP
ncbi:VWA domain-containing protein [Patescibacteria group bacterium]|nr:VWA domain-containing protein [Patescibacteria group bacterium]MBU4511942.1 VWA domain-containing protein [Patescibacteria group bacterium]MCG2693051.1 VWA domain-containing protein [Candidatus Parcubacteria bacterium]